MLPRADRWKDYWRRFWAFQRKNNGFSILQRYYERHLTPTGKALLLLQTVSLSLGLVGTEVLIYTVMCVFMALWSSVLVVGWLSRPKTWQLEQFKLPVFTAHQSQTLHLGVKHPHRRLVFHAQMEAYLTPEDTGEGIRLRSHGMVPEINAEATAFFSMRWKPLRRGRYTLRSLSLVSLFPMQLMRWRRVKAMTHTLWVYPEITLPPDQVGMGVQQGIHQRHHLARQQAEHLAGTRPWRSGDSPRFIHWAGFARTGQLTVKEFQQTHKTQVGFVVGGGTPAQHEDFEDALSLMAGFLSRWSQGHPAAEDLVFLQLGNRLLQTETLEHYWQHLSAAQVSDVFSWSDYAEQWPQVNQVIYIGLSLPAHYAQIVEQLSARGIQLLAYVPEALGSLQRDLRVIPRRAHRAQAGKAS